MITFPYLNFVHKNTHVEQVVKKGGRERKIW